jgi:hypothetical protein
MHRSWPNWVVAEFSNKTAFELELISTIVYADREVGQKGDTLDILVGTRML